MMKRFLTLLTVGLLACTVLGFFGRIHWLFDLLAHFRVQYLVFSGLFAFSALMLRSRPVFTTNVLILVVNFVQIAPYYQPIASAASPEAAQLRVMTANVNSDIGNETTVIETVLASEADVVAIIELNPLLAEQLRLISSHYPYQHLQTMDNSHFGIGIISKRPLLSARTLWLGTLQLPSLYAEVEVDGQRAAIVATHPPPPIFGYGTAFRDSQMADVTGVANATALPLIVLGDLNATPWSSALRDLTQQAALRDSALGHGLNPTWLSNQHPFGIPIDYVLISAEFSTLTHQVGHYIGSDHFPIVATLLLHRQ